MIKRPLEELFFATYRGAQDFKEFQGLDLSKSYREMLIDGRVVYGPHKELKLYLGFLNRILFNRLPVNNEVVYSYRKGVNAVDAVRKHSAGKYFFQTDISDFFGSISRDLIRETILNSLDFCPISDINDWLERILDVVTIKGVLPPGYPTSPVISNCCLIEFDRVFSSWCADKGLIYTRYADDLIVSSQNDELMRDLFSIVSSMLGEVFSGDVALNEKKTRFIRPGMRVKILGIAILPNGKVSVDGKVKKSAEIAMYYLHKDRAIFKTLMKHEDFDSAMQKFSGQLNYINTVDPGFLDKLRKKYGSAAVDMAIHYSVEI